MTPAIELDNFCFSILYSFHTPALCAADGIK